MLKRLRERLDALNAEIRAINTLAETEQRTALTSEETDKYAELRTEREQLEARIVQVKDEDDRRAAAGKAAELLGNTGNAGPDGIPVAYVTSEPTIYGRGSGNSYFLDVARAKTGIDGPGGVTERLQRHVAELDVDMPKREARRAKRAADGEERMTRNGGQFEKRVNPNRTDGQGGYFVPPLWLVDEFIGYLRAGRTTANLAMQLDLPTGTDSINLPKVATGSTTATQLDAGTVSSTDITDTFVSAPVRTIAGGQDVAMQLLDQSPVAFDEIVFKDLMGSYNQQLDLGALNGSGASGALKGLTIVSGTNTVTYTDATPTAGELYPVLGQAASQVARQRFQMPTGVVVTPQRWFWLVTQVDSTGRPLVLPKGQPGFNAMGAYDGTAEGLAGEIFGIPIYVDANVVSNLGVGANQDQIIVSKFDDQYLWEGALRTRALTEVLSGTLQVRLQLWNYVAFMPDRYLTSISVIGGTGLISPAGF